MTKDAPVTAPKALVIEDDPALYLIFSKALQSAGFETNLAVEGQQALTQLEADPPDMILLDLHLPKVSGQAILRHVRATQHLANIPVMITTADALMAEQLRFEADMVLLKPICFNYLRDMALRFKDLPRT